MFNQQSKKVILNECKNEIPTRGIPSVMNEYFPELNKILQEYLTSQILQKQCDQMAQSLCYDVVLIEVWLLLLNIKNQIKENELDEMDPGLSFQHLANFRKTSNIVQSRGLKQKYRFDMSYAKKALDIAVQADKVNEFINQMEYFIENVKVDLSEQQKNAISMHISDLLRIRHKDNEEVIIGQEDRKRERHCKKCNQVGHYTP
ncbi:hypothetical protein C1646_773119 [Rhizophagus diaphanus]|nr:hypothetical protein C1646_773119 [Rhizophagus diaphanus] [Rhizophagus sp. MUCL 43196]